MHGRQRTCSVSDVGFVMSTNRVDRLPVFVLFLMVSDPAKGVHLLQRLIVI